jgi:hypothetical protein
LGVRQAHSGSAPPGSDPGGRCDRTFGAFLIRPIAAAGGRTTPSVTSPGPLAVASTNRLTLVIGAL